jgi:D-glycero-D-manno-heptose 1,7-bisphosphate phosphatase
MHVQTKPANRAHGNATAARYAVFLDRDGVLTRTYTRDGISEPPRSLAELQLLPGVNLACRRLRAAGFLLAIVTNQPDVARGRLELDIAEAINGHTAKLLRVDLAMLCPHTDEDRCECRKPAPGMILAAAKRLRATLSGSYMVGDQHRDVEAGRRAGCRTILITNLAETASPADMTVTDLSHAVDWIIKDTGAHLRPRQTS